MDRDFQDILKKNFTLKYEQALQNYIAQGGIEGKNIQIFKMVFEIGSYFMGYENPETITDHEQRFVKNEWTIFVRTKETSF